MTTLIALVAEAGITLEPPPQQAHETVVTVQDALGHPRSGETVRAVLRPGLGAEREVSIGITDGRGRTRWTPDAWGFAQLRAGDEQVAVHVAPDPVDPIIPIVFFALALVGIGSLVTGWREARS